MVEVACRGGGKDDIERDGGAGKGEVVIGGSLRCCSCGNIGYDVVTVFIPLILTILLPIGGTGGSLLATVEELEGTLSMGILIGKGTSL